MRPNNPAPSHFDPDFCYWLTLSQQDARARDAALRAWETGESLPAPGTLPGWLDACLAWIDAAPSRHGIGYSDPRYPPHLRSIACPPVVLFVEGRPELLAAPAVAVVGARKASAGGVENARRLSAELARAGVVVVSGLALGIDGAAHQGALDARGDTIAVLGCGPDQVYPRAHAGLLRAVAASGAVVSEFVPGTRPLRQHFPRRNRIISGLAGATIVIEAGLRSGSLGTARLAAGQGREVGAVPGALQNPMARGSNQLLREGAAVITGVEDILDLLPESARLTPPPGGVTGKNTETGAPGHLDRLLAALEPHPVSMDALLGRTGWEPARLAAGLAELELAGAARREAGGYCRTCSEWPKTLVSRALCEQEN